MRVVRQNWNPYNSGLAETVGHRRRLYENWYPSDFLCWASEQLCENKTYKIIICFGGHFIETLCRYPTVLRCLIINWFQIYI